MHNLLFQLDEMNSKDGDHRLSTTEFLISAAVKIISTFVLFSSAIRTELLHFRGAEKEGVPTHPTSLSQSSCVGFGNVHMSFHVKSDVDMTEFANKLVEESHKKGLTEVAINRKIDVESRDELDKAPASYAMTEFPGSFEGWALIYAKGPNGEQLEFNQVRSVCKENFKKAMEQYNKLNQTSHTWPEG